MIDPVVILLIASYLTFAFLLFRYSSGQQKIYEQLLVREQLNKDYARDQRHIILAKYYNGEYEISVVYNDGTPVRKACKDYFAQQAIMDGQYDHLFEETKELWLQKKKEKNLQFSQRDLT